MNKSGNKGAGRSAQARLVKADLIDHDEIFKALLTIFFLEFVAAFLPGVAPYLDSASIEFMDKELLRGVSGRGKRYVDLVVKARFKGQMTYFLIHVENQSKSETGFAKRIFRYFARLLEKFDLPVYPVVILSYDAPIRPEPDRYEVVFPDVTVLQFQYKVIQLNRLSWKDYIKTPNPTAAALMTKMAIAPEDRTKVASEITRMMLTLKLDPDKSDLIFSFMESYLKLTGEELKKYKQELDEPASEEEKDMIRTPPYSSWGREKYAQWTEIGKQEGRQEGRQEGILEGRKELIARQIERRFGAASEQATEGLNALASEQLDELGVALFDFTSAADVENWLAKQTTH